MQYLTHLKKKDLFWDQVLFTEPERYPSQDSWILFWELIYLFL